MDDDVAAVDQHPVAGGGALDPDLRDAGGLELHLQMLGHGAQLPRGAAGGDDHEVGDAGFTGEVDGDHIFGLVVVERFLDQAEKLLRCGRGFAPAGLGLACYGDHPFVVALRTFDRRFLISVAEIGLSRACTNNQAGGTAMPVLRPAPSFNRYRANRRAALAASA